MLRFLTVRLKADTTYVVHGRTAIDVVTMSCRVVPSVQINPIRLSDAIGYPEMNFREC